MFSKRIKKILKAKRISQRKLSKDLEINEGQLSHYLKYNDKMSLDNIIRILYYLDPDIDLDSLLKDKLREEKGK
jgi:transcriptional regulator with XRE-family HTH domain